MEPDLELVQVRDDQSFKIWSHGYPYRTVRWHFHPEYELHLVTATEGTFYVGDHIGAFRPSNLVFVGPNLPHNWISDVAPGETVEERCLVLQFTSAFIKSCTSTFPELRFIEWLLAESFRGVEFAPPMGEAAAPILREMLNMGGARRIELFIRVLNLIGHSHQHHMLASPNYRPDPSGYMSAAMNNVLAHIGRNFTNELSEAELARLNNQSVSAFSRGFRKHTGMTFVQYVNSLRIELACQHLTQDDLSMTEICYEVGFNNVSNFNRQFLAWKSMPPSKFRSLHKSGMSLAPACPDRGYSMMRTVARIARDEERYAAHTELGEDVS